LTDENRTATTLNFAVLDLKVYVLNTKSPMNPYAVNRSRREEEGKDEEKDEEK